VSIGFALCKAFAQAGATVALNGNFAQLGGGGVQPLSSRIRRPTVVAQFGLCRVSGNTYALMCQGLADTFGQKNGEKVGAIMKEDTHLLDIDNPLAF